MFHKIELPLPINEKFRNTPLPSASANDEFEEILSALLPRYIPVGLCEALPHFVQWAKVQRLPQKGCIVTSVGLYNNPELFVLSGVQKRPLCIVEHGGNGMFTASDPHLYAEHIAADRYFSSGHGKYSLPSPYFASHFTRKKLSPPLLIGNDSHRFIVRLMPVFGEGSMQPYHQRRKKFLWSLQEKDYPHVRMYFKEFGWGARSSLLKSFPTLCIQDNAVPIEQAMADTSLVILDHCLTTFFRTMATNTPTIIFAPPSGFSAEAEEVIARMRAVGIWHDTPEGAARFYTSLVGNHAGNWDIVEKNVSDWWLGSDVQSIRNLFCDNFAKTSPNWSREWLSAFDALAEEWNSNQH